MASLMSLIGRLLISMIFILSGISKLGSFAATVTYMESRGIPAAPFFLYVAVLVEVGAGLSVASGFRARIGALILVAFLIPTTFIFHFKPAFDANMNLIDKTQMIALLKNVAIIGGLLLLYGNGAGKFTIGKDA